MSSTVITMCAGNSLTGLPALFQNSVAVAPGNTTCTRTPLLPIVAQRLAESEHESLGSTVHGVEHLGRQRHDRRDVDDGALAAIDEGARRRMAEPREGSDVEIDHALHGVEAGLQRRRVQAHAGIVHQHADAGVGLQQVLDAPQVRCIFEVGRHGLDDRRGFRLEARGQRIEPISIARHQDEVVAAARQAVRVSRADSRGCARDQRRALVRLSTHGHHSFDKRGGRRQGEGTPPARIHGLTAWRTP
jgi:hypothetical protein